MRIIRTVLFDLDGTLLDTAPDLAAALNAILEENRRAPLDLLDWLTRINGAGRDMPGSPNL